MVLRGLSLSVPDSMLMCSPCRVFTKTGIYYIGRRPCATCRDAVLRTMQAAEMVAGLRRGARCRLCLKTTRLRALL